MSPALRVALSIAVICDCRRSRPGFPAARGRSAPRCCAAAGRRGFLPRPAHIRPRRATPDLGVVVVTRASGDRDDLVDRRFLHQRRTEVRIGEVDDVDAVGRVAVDDVLRDRLRVGVGRVLHLARVELRDDLLWDRAAAAPGGPCGRRCRTGRSCPAPISSSAWRRTARTMLLLNAPASPRSLVATMIRWVSSLPVPGEQLRALRPGVHPRGQRGDHLGHARRIGPAAIAFCWARRSFDAATMFSALVIFCVDFTEPMRILRALRLAIAVPY